MCLAAGCGSDPARQQVESLREENRQLQDQLKKQGNQLTSAAATIERQNEQIQTLQALGGPRRLPLLNAVSRVVIEDLSGGYDHDGKPGDDGIVIYLQPLDADGDVIKAAGAIQLQLLDLANPDPQQILQECRWAPDEARKAWYGRLLTSHYTLRCPWGSSGPPRHTSITARVIFNEALTGQRFEVQKLIDIKLAPPAARAEGRHP